MPDNVGVGDVLQYEVGATYYVAFISGRTHASSFTIQDRTGTMDGVVFSGVFAKSGRYLQDGALVMLVGTKGGSQFGLVLAG